MAVSEQAQVSARITLRNLVAARWVLIALVGAGVVVIALGEDRVPVGLLPRSDRPLVVLVVLGLWILLNLASTWALRHDRASEQLAGAHLLTDALALTALLALSGGPANPFTLLYFVPITLATQLTPRWTWVLAGVCVLGFAALFVVVGATQPSHHAAHFEGHQQGMWIAFGLVGVLITVFVHRTALALARQRDELARLRQIALEDRHLTALGTLAAGAAHELGTPLATIKLLIDELPHLPAAEHGEALTTVREQIDRCKLIVSRMASPELRVSALASHRAWPLADLVAELDAIELDVSIEFAVEPGVGERRCTQPFEPIAQLLRELLHNAADACRRTGDPSRGVEVQLRADARRVHVEVIDRGVGMDEAGLAAAFDPFHSTRPEGSGLGMGLYLARAHLRQLGGSIELESELDHGTCVRIELPLQGEAHA